MQINIETNMILLEFKTYGITWTLVYHPLFDGPLEIWEACKYCEVIKCDEKPHQLKNEDK